jgi:hypothetical protein
MSVFSTSPEIEWIGFLYANPMGGAAGAWAANLFFYKTDHDGTIIFGYTDSMGLDLPTIERYEERILAHIKKATLNNSIPSVCCIKFDKDRPGVVLTPAQYRSING